MNINGIKFFSETEKNYESISDIKYNSDDWQTDGSYIKMSSIETVEILEEQCSELWNKIKDSLVLNGRELSVSSYQLIINCIF